MKWNFGQHLLLFLHWLLSLIGCVLAALLLITPGTVDNLIGGMYGLIGKRSFDTIGIVFCAIYILLAAGCATMIFSGWSKRRERGLITVFSNETGKTRIAVSAVEQMTRQAIAGVEGISDVKAAINGGEDAIGITISLVLKRGAYLPAVTANIQRTVRGYIEQNCGVAVQTITVNVRAVEGDMPGAGRESKREPSVDAAPTFYAEPAAESVPQPDAGETWDVAETASPAPEDATADDMPSESSGEDEQPCDAEQDSTINE